MANSRSGVDIFLRELGYGMSAVEFYEQEFVETSSNMNFMNRLHLESRNERDVA